jgi:hypothetical protein
MLGKIHEFWNRIASFQRAILGKTPCCLLLIAVLRKTTCSLVNEHW